MAEFCTNCAKKLSLPRPDIDFDKLISELELGKMTNFLCEGCGARGIGKDSKGDIFIFDKFGNAVPYKLAFEFEQTARQTIQEIYDLPFVYNIVTQDITDSSGKKLLSLSNWYLVQRLPFNNEKYQSIGLYLTDLINKDNEQQ